MSVRLLSEGPGNELWLVASFQPRGDRFSKDFVDCPFIHLFSFLCRVVCQYYLFLFRLFLYVYSFLFFFSLLT